MSEDSQDEYLKWKDKENSKWSKISRNVKPLWIFIFFAVLFYANYLVTSNQLSRGVFILFAVAFGVLLIFLMFRETNELKLIPEQIIKRIAYNAMEVKRKEGIEIPSDARIRVTMISGACYEQDVITGTSGIIKREVGVEVIIKNRLKKSYIVGIHPYNGSVLDLLPQPLGIGNKDALKKDIKIIPVQFLDNKN